jgi:hypothetical protein
MREGTLVDNPFSNARWMDDFDVLAYLAEVDEEEEINKGYNIPTVEVKTKKPFTFKPLTKTG